ncbi:bifunctional protein-serine/threonine kinase/phosphatase [Colwellia sp. MSW7]|uniref:Bifunctional protein-serine/threonine kinase/phosphatase n=1 Tax=Colwellia maritima TaxID=2912588 RepID=A0ABS9WWS5_9GAMM|nr:bifunctional protein-serine/threonine kinase/phosphatase [Colwellia maritima]MCI2282316.1 bifunctional protein-serine/threonine kinase/phosphatase [Colwellia maritima]
MIDSYAVDLQRNNTQNQFNDSLAITFGGYSSQGDKSENQDAFALKMSEGLDLELKGHVAVIADGLSSANCAAKASQMSVCHFIEEYLATPETWSVKKSAAKVISSLNKWLYSRQLIADEKGLSEQWFSTFSALVLKGDRGHVFHVGDCQIVKINSDGYQELTKDHATISGTLTRALGADSHIEVDYKYTSFAPQDIIMLSCDGVHHFVKPKQIIGLLQENKNLEKVSKAICQLASEQGSQDNLTCLLIKIEQLPQQAFNQLVFTRLQQVIPPTLKLGSKLDHFEILDVLHQTSRSHVYLAKDIIEKKLVVIKIPSVNFVDDIEYLSSFIKEGWIGEKITHPAIMKIYPRIIDSKFLYHVCEYIEGQTLAAWMKDNPKPSLIKVRDILDQLIKILRVLQRQDVVHCDIKGDNFIIDSHGRVKLIDFGSSVVGVELDNSLSEKVDQYSFNQGTLNFSAPELFYGHENNHQSELYSLAVLIYQMLTNRLPYKEISQLDTVPKQYNLWRYKPITTYRIDLPKYLDRVMSTALAANPVNRYEHYSEFLAQFTISKNTQLNVQDNLPLLERDPVKFWQGISAVLLMILISVLIYK